MNKNISLADEEIKECIGSYNFTLIVEEDKEMFSILKNPYIIALKCTVKNGNSVLGVGRSNSVLSPKNKFLKNAVLYSWGASVIDALSKSVKTLNNLPLKTTIQKENIEEEDLEGRDKPAYFTENDNLKYASEKQKNFLKKLVSKCDSSKKREYENKLQSPYLSSFECSALIKNLLTK